MAQQGGDQSPRGGGGGPSSRLSEEEARVLKECENESFFRRGLPLSCGAVVGVQFLVRSGKIARHPKFGAIPKSIIAGGLAYLFGKLSYLPECRKKILEKIPDSNLAQTIKKAQGGQQPDFRSMSSGQEAEGEAEPSHRNRHIADTPSYEGLNDSKRPSLDNEVKTPDAPEEKKSTTYDDLRQRNRQDYKDSHQAAPSSKQPPGPSYKDSQLMPQKPWPDRNGQQSPQEPPPSEPSKRKRTNIWGDVIDE